MVPKARNLVIPIFLEGTEYLELSGKLVVPKVSAARMGVLDSVFVPHFTYDGFEFSSF